MMRIAELPAEIRSTGMTTVSWCPFSGKRRTLGTCPLNGGCRENLTAVFNNDMNPGPGMACRMLADTSRSIW